MHCPAQAVARLPARSKVATTATSEPEPWAARPAAPSREWGALAGGAIGGALGYAFGGVCFVAGTQVVIGVEDDGGRDALPEINARCEESVATATKVRYVTRMKKKGRSPLSLILLRPSPLPEREAESEPFRGSLDPGRFAEGSASFDRFPRQG